MTLLLCKLIHFDVYFGFYIAWTGIRDTCLLFGGILMACYLWNLIRIWRQKSIELLHAEAVGEREPRTKWLLTLIGVAALGTGYYLAVTIDDAMQALSFYFVAVILVIIGTYCLFTAVSITVLKLLRCNKRYYYRTKHFIGISDAVPHEAKCSGTGQYLHSIHHGAGDGIGHAGHVSLEQRMPWTACIPMTWWRRCGMMPLAEPPFQQEQGCASCSPRRWNGAATP